MLDWAYVLQRWIEAPETERTAKIDESMRLLVSLDTTLASIENDADEAEMQVQVLIRARVLEHVVRDLLESKTQPPSALIDWYNRFFALPGGASPVPLGTCAAPDFHQPLPSQEV